MRCILRNPDCLDDDHGMPAANWRAARGAQAAFAPSGTVRRCSRAFTVAATEKYDAGSAADIGSLQKR